MFYHGQKVVCIDDRFLPVRADEVRPIKGHVYTIRRIFSFPGNSLVGLSLYEVVNAPRKYLEGVGECGFDSTGFRPLDERKTDISVFTALLTPTKVSEKVGGK